MAREIPALARHVDDVFPEVEQRLELEEPVSDMLGSPAFDAVRRLVTAEIDAIYAGMDSARQPLERDEYALRHGRVDGLRGFERAAETLLARVEAERTASEQASEDASTDAVLAGR